MALNWIEPNFSNPESPFIPPLEARTYDLHKKGRLPTPIDKVTGLVDKRALVNLVKSTVVPGYDWTSPSVPRPTTTRHHLLWPHNWTHDVTYPAAPPSRESAHEYVEARRLADKMQAIARNPAFLAKETLRINQEVVVDITEERLDILRFEIEEDKQIDLSHQLDIFSKLFEVAKSGPEEFQVIDYAGFELSTVPDMLRIAHKLGRQVTMEASIDKGLLPQEQTKLAA